MPDINVGKFGKNSGIDLSTYKAGLKAQDLKTDMQKSIFKAADKDGNGVLDETELQNFRQQLDTDGDNNVSKKEANKFLKANGFSKKDKDELLKLLQEFNKNTENISDVQEFEKDGQKLVKITYKDGSEETIFPDKSSQIVTKDDENKTTTTKYLNSEGVLQKQHIESEEYTTDVTFEQDGETPAQDITTYKNNATTITRTYENGKPVKKEETKGTTTTTYKYGADGQELLDTRVENEGLEAKETRSTFSYNDDGTITETQKFHGGNGTNIRKLDADGVKILTEEITENGKTAKRTYNYNDKDHPYYKEETTDDKGNPTVNIRTPNHKGLIQQKTVDGKTYTIKYDGNGNTKGIIVQNGETLEAIAKKFNCSVNDLKELNKDLLKNGKLPVGAEIKVPGELEADDKRLLGRKSAQEAKAEFARDEAQRARQRKLDRQFDRDLRQNYGLKNYNGRGKKITGTYAGGTKATFTVIGQAGYQRTIVKDKKGNVHVISHDGKVLKDTYAMNTAKYRSRVLADGTRVAIIGNRKDGHGRQIGLDANGRQVVISQDGQILRNDYVSASDDYDKHKKDQRTQTSGVGYGRAANGRVWYFNDNNQGRALTGQARADVVKRDTDYAAQLLRDGADYTWGTDEEKIERGVRSIYSAEIMGGVNANLRAAGYEGDNMTTPVEALLLDELSREEAAAHVRVLADNGAYGNAQETAQALGRNCAREVEYQLHGGLGITKTEDLNHAMDIASTPEARRATEAYMAELHPELTANDGSITRAAIADDGFEPNEVDRFDAVWIKNGAYAEAVYAKDDQGNIIMGADGKPVVLDAGDQAHRNAVINRLCFEYADDDESLHTGLGAINSDPASADYRNLSARATVENQRKGYQARFTGQEDVQTWLAGRTQNDDRTVDTEHMSACNNLLFKGEIPVRVQAEAQLYEAQKGDLSQMFTSMDPAVYGEMAQIIANGDVPGVTSMQDAYDKAMASPDGSVYKSEIKANAMISGQVNFSDQEKIDFCIELMHSIDYNTGTGLSTGQSGSAINYKNTQTEQLKAILSRNPQILESLKNRVAADNFTYTYSKHVGGPNGGNTTVNTVNTKNDYLALISDTKCICMTQDSVFLDENGNQITDPAQIQALKEANMKALSEMRKYVAELEREFRTQVDTEGAFSGLANSGAATYNIGTDRDDVANKYRQAKLMLAQFEAAAQGKLRDSNGNVISAQDLAHQMISADELAQTNADYKTTIATGKTAIIMAPVIAVTTVATAGTSSVLLGGAIGGASAAGATYTANAIEYNTSETGNTAAAREQNLIDSGVAGVSTFIGAGQMKYIPKLFNNASTFVRGGGRLSMVLASDVGVGAAGEYVQSGTVTVEGVAMNAIFSATGNFIGLRSLAKRQPATTGMVHVTDPTPTPSRAAVHEPIGGGTTPHQGIEAPHTRANADGAGAPHNRTNAGGTDAPHSRTNMDDASTIHAHETDIPNPSRSSEHVDTPEMLQERINALNTEVKEGNLARSLKANYSDILDGHFTLDPNNPEQVQQLKNKLRRMMIEVHPDRGGSEDLAKAVNGLWHAISKNDVNPATLQDAISELNNVISAKTNGLQAKKAQLSKMQSDYEAMTTSRVDADAEVTGNKKPADEEPEVVVVDDEPEVVVVDDEPEVVVVNEDPDVELHDIGNETDADYIIDIDEFGVEHHYKKNADGVFQEVEMNTSTHSTDATGSTNGASATKNATLRDKLSNMSNEKLEKVASAIEARIEKLPNGRVKEALKKKLNDYKGKPLSEKIWKLLDDLDSIDEMRDIADDAIRCIDDPSAENLARLSYDVSNHYFSKYDDDILADAGFSRAERYSYGRMRDEADANIKDGAFGESDDINGSYEDDYTPGIDDAGMDDFETPVDAGSSAFGMAADIIGGISTLGTSIYAALSGDDEDENKKKNK